MHLSKLGILFPTSVPWQAAAAATLMAFFHSSKAKSLEIEKTTACKKSSTVSMVGIGHKGRSRGRVTPVAGDLRVTD